MNIQNKEFCTYTTRDAAHKPPLIGVAPLGPPGIHSFLDCPSEWPAAMSMEAATPPTIQSKILGDSFVLTALVLAPLVLPPVDALFVVFADVLYAP